MEKRLTVLVTGAGGFIGRHLVESQLELDRKVIAVDIDVAELRDLSETDNLQVVEADIRDTGRMVEVLREVDTVFNLAAAHLEVGTEESYFTSVNVIALDGLLKAASAAGVRRFVHCSSVGVYGSISELPANEQSPCHPDIAYERSKLEGEKKVRELADDRGMETVILRPSWVYGPHCPRTLKLISTIAKRRFFFVGPGRNYRHPIYVSDLMSAFDLAATIPDAHAETILIAGPEAVTVSELFDIISTSLSVSYRPWRLPMPIVSLGCAVLEWVFFLLDRQPPFSRRSLKFFTENSSFSTDKARTILGFEAQIGLADGIKMTIADARSRHLL